MKYIPVVVAAIVFSYVISMGLATRIGRSLKTTQAVSVPVSVSNEFPFSEDILDVCINEGLEIGWSTVVTFPAKESTGRREQIYGWDMEKLGKLNSYRISSIEMGWPFHCVYDVNLKIRPLRSPDARMNINRPRQIQIVGVDQKLPWTEQETRRAFSLTPIWSGLLKNMLFFTVLITSLYCIPDLLRRRKDMCSCCGIVMKSNETGTCPECGYAA